MRVRKSEAREGAKVRWRARIANEQQRQFVWQNHRRRKVRLICAAREKVRAARLARAPNLAHKQQAERGSAFSALCAFGQHTFERANTFDKEEEEEEEDEIEEEAGEGPEKTVFWRWGENTKQRKGEEHEREEEEEVEELLLLRLTRNCLKSFAPKSEREAQQRRQRRRLRPWPEETAHLVVWPAKLRAKARLFYFPAHCGYHLEGLSSGRP